MIYHITTHEAWEEAQKTGGYSAASLESEGFIHCSRRDQIVAVANDFYRGRERLALLCIDEDKLDSELRWEAPAHPSPEAANATSDESLFPHLYGRLNLDAVVAVFDFNETAAGFALPPALP